MKEKFAGFKFIRTFAIPSETEEQTTVANPDLGTILESWQSGRMRRSWKPLILTGPGVRIPHSPQNTIKNRVKLTWTRFFIVFCNAPRSGEGCRNAATKSLFKNQWTENKEWYIPHTSELWSEHFHFRIEGLSWRVRRTIVKVGRLAQKATMPSRLLPNRTTVTEMGSFITRWSPKHYKNTLINDHRDTFPSKCVTAVKDIIARLPLEVNR